MPVKPAFKTVIKKDGHKFKASLSYIVQGQAELHNEILFQNKKINQKKRRRKFKI